MKAALGLVLLLALPHANAQNASDAANASAAPSSPYDHSPIRYHLDTSNLTLATRWYDVKIYQAFAWWSEHGMLEMGWTPQFQRVDDAASADVRMWFRDSTRVGDTCDNNTEALGCARSFSEGQAGSTAAASGSGATHYQGATVDIEIKTRRDGDGAHYSYDVIGDVAKHEIGHALGLPHSPRRDDIMFPSFDTTAYADARPVDDIRPALVGIGVVLLIIVGSVWAIGRAARASSEDDELEERKEG